MRVGLLTSWRVPCGVAEHSARIAEALRSAGADPVILAARAGDERSIPEQTDFEVYEVGAIGMWRNDGRYWLDVDAILALDLAVVHVQYQGMLFNAPPLATLARSMRSAITFHDNCIAPDLDVNAFDLRFSYHPEVGVNPIVIPFGVEDRPPLIRSFGLGRNRTDVVSAVCERNGWRYEDGSSHEPIHGGGQKWRPHAELIDWLRGADAIVLWYPDISAIGESAAARTALATRRPVVVNDVTSFRALPTEAHNFRKVPDDEGALETALREFVDSPYVEGCSWANVAARLLDAYA